MHPPSPSRPPAATASHGPHGDRDAPAAADAPDDCAAALRWLHRAAPRLGIDAGRVAVLGESAGGNPAAVLARDTAAFLHRHLRPAAPPRTWDRRVLRP